MKCQNFARVLFSFLFVLTEVAPWTIDLPEVRRFLFEKENKISKNEYEDYVSRDKTFYSNIEGNSKHNSEGHYDSDKYAQEFGYQSYMEKKVQEIVHDGSRYLEGLRRSLEDYSRFLEDCNRRNSSNFSNSTNSSSSWTPPVTPTGPNMTMSFNSSDTRFQDLNPANWMGMNGTFNGMNMTGMSMNGVNMSWVNTTWMNTTSPGRMSCQEATEKSEKVRRFADLAMWATRRLQDIAYAEKYQKTDKYEENELILKLAWFLDQLAALTGYEPDYKEYLNRVTTSTTTAAPMAITLVPQTQELINYLINCVKANFSVPATERCQYPFPLPDMVAQLVGGTSTQSPQSDGNNVIPMSPPDSSAQQSLELLVTSDDFRIPRKITKRSPIPDEYYVPIPVHEKPKPIVDFIVKKLTNLKAIVKSVKKHAVADFASQIAVHKHLHKRAIDDDSTVLNRLSDDSKSNVEVDKSNVEVDKSNVEVDKSNVEVAKSNVEVDKSNVEVDKSNVEVDKSNVETVPTIHLPVLDVSVINTKSFKKRSIDDTSMYSNLINSLSKRKLTVKSHKKAVKTVNKRSAENPLSKLANYYIKYKIWDGANPSQAKIKDASLNFDVHNDLQPSKKSKRSLFYKKHRHFLLPKSFLPLRKHKKLHSAKKGKGKLLSYFENMIEKKHRKFEKNRHKIIKRSLLYEHMYLPRIPMDPTGDISYYVKNKEGREYNPSLTQAAQVRLGLQQIFQTGNIEVVHRYGSNYNPANPAVFMTGVLKGAADA